MTHRSLLSFLGWLLLSASTLVGQPKLFIVGGNTFDFGTVVADSRNEHVVLLKNDGKKALTITNITTSCGCTGTMLSKERIPPHQTGKLAVTFHAPTAIGAVRKEIGFDTNDPDQKHVHIDFNANVIFVLTAEPEYVIFKTTPDSSATQTFLLTNESVNSLKILSVTTSSPSIAATLPRTELHSQDSVVLSVTFNPKEAGTTNGIIQLKTDHPKMPELDIRYFTFVREKHAIGSKPDSK
jgi:hypothetical protein